MPMWFRDEERPAAMSHTRGGYLAMVDVSLPNIGLQNIPLSIYSYRNDSIGSIFDALYAG